MKTKLESRFSIARSITMRDLIAAARPGCSLPRAVRLLFVGTVLFFAGNYPLRAQTTWSCTITNPTPGFYSDSFGWSVAMADTNRVLIGAPQDSTVAWRAGAAYWYGANGTLLNTFTNGAGLQDDGFGWSVAVVGPYGALIGAPADDRAVTNSGAAYLFNANGTLLTVFTNPTPAGGDYFGGAVAAVGTDRVLISAYLDDAGAVDAGVVHLFRTNGVLLTTITNPTPATFEEFGYSLAVLGTDWLVVGARADNKGGAGAGAVHLFTTNGTLLITITNPTPASYDYFGAAVAPLGGDRVLIGTPSDNTGATDAGAAYIYSTNGTLLTTLTNPTPAYMDAFGTAVAAVGQDKVLIGAYRDDTGATDTGIVYLFGTDGALLATITNPAPEAYDSFGGSLAAAGNCILIGAYSDSAGTASAGAVHFYTQQTPGGPALAIFRTTTNTVAVTWPSPSTGWTLQENPHSVGSVNWSNVTSGIQDDGTTKSVLINPPVGNRFYRLYKPCYE